jgi:hypothetical protein
VLLDGRPTEYELKKNGKFKDKGKQQLLDGAAEALKAQANVVTVGYSSGNDEAVITSLATEPVDGASQWAFFSDEISTVAEMLLANRQQICNQLCGDRCARLLKICFNDARWMLSRIPCLAGCKKPAYM